MGATQDFRVKEFRFPQFSINIVSSFEAHGTLRDNVWEVVAKGPRYDGRDLFQSFFDINMAVDKGGKHRPGLDLRADIETVVGFYETSLRGVHMSMQKRAGKLVQLDARGMLGGNKTFEAVVRPESARSRVLIAKSADAGQMFKLVGFYPHAVGGDMTLEVNLDGQGVAERTGLLTVYRFHVLGDAVTVKTDNEPGSRRSRKNSEVREKFEFTSLRAPFEVGHGQFVLKDAAIEGPLVSANMRGKVDFRTRKLHIGGTFTPLSTLNKLPVLTELPIVGDIVTGPRRDGVFAFTYALQGGLENPQLMVNPFSGIMPGISRELMQITPDDPRVIPRNTKQGPRGDTDGARSSASPAIGPGSDEAGGEAWVSETAKPARKKK
jgi:AsmA-like C-terminal region